ncbi:MAG: hypothetical protein M9905_07505 [Rhizobiaceae bacterium]|nr:hypothetical protein [Rhizobiaceae bacterium]
MKALKSMNFLVTIFVSTSAALPALSQNGEGIRGRHYATMNLRLEKATRASIVGTCITTNARSGNKTRPVIYVDGILRFDQTFEKASADGTVDVTGRGDHKILLQCYNENSDASSAIVTVDDGDETIVR